MLKVQIICCGKMREKYLISAFDEYKKRLAGYCKFECLELPEEKLPSDPSQKEIEKALQKEAAEIQKNIPNGFLKVAMCVEGKQLSSEKFASMFNEAAISGKPGLCFIIGSSYGMDESVKKDADVRLSMSEMTFPHHLARVMMAEQIYRAFKILEGSKYHK